MGGIGKTIARAARSALVALCVGLPGVGVPVLAAAEPIGSIVVGAYYYRKGMINDPKVQVIEVDRSRHRVKVFDIESNNVDWIAPDQLLNRTDSTSRDIDRLVIGLKILDALMKPEEPAPPPKRRTVWTPGAAHPKHPHVVASSKKNVWNPAPGYVFVNPDKSFATRWKPGRHHPKHANVVAADKVERWRPEPGYEWVDSKKSWRVRWKPGLRHPQMTLVAGVKKGDWLDAREWRVEDRGAGADPRYLPTLSQPNERRAPTTVRRLFASEGGGSGFDLYLERKKGELFVFHAAKIDDDAIDYLLFHPEERWMMVVMKNGERVDLGDRVHRLMAGDVAKLDKIAIVRTRNGEVQEGRGYHLKKATGAWDSATSQPSFVLGVALKALNGFDLGGQRIAGGARVEWVLPDFPAEGAEFRPGDIIFRIDGREVFDAASVANHLDRVETDNVLIHFVRDGEARSVATAAKDVRE